MTSDYFFCAMEPQFTKIFLSGRFISDYFYVQSYDDLQSSFFLVCFLMIIFIFNYPQITSTENILSYIKKICIDSILLHFVVQLYILSHYGSLNLFSMMTHIPRMNFPETGQFGDSLSC